MRFFGSGIRFIKHKPKNWASVRYAKARGLPWKNTLPMLRPGKLRSAAIKAQRTAVYMAKMALKIALRNKLKNMRRRR